MKKNINIYLVVYFFILILFAIFFLYKKHDVGNDSTIAEWIINYSGGFTKRGLIGDISIIFSNLFSYNLRDIIFVFQATTVGIYFICLYFFLRNLELNRLLLLSLFSPIFILYPIAEIEVLARKEIFIFIFFIVYIFIPKNKTNFHNLFKLVFFSISILIWEPVVFFLSFWVALDIIRNENKKLNLNFLINLCSYIPAMIIAGYIALNPMSSDQHDSMVEFLKYNFSEDCYAACFLLKSKSTILDQFKDNLSLYSIETFIRYILIIIVGFGPLFLLSFHSKIKNKELFFFKNFNNLLFPFLILLSPTLILFAMGVDWGRWVNISYVHYIIFYLYLYKNNLLYISKDSSKIINLNYISKNIYIVIFIFYCFSWNPKTVITGDVASFPGYRVPYKFIKAIIKE